MVRLAIRIHAPARTSITLHDRTFTMIGLMGRISDVWWTAVKRLWSRLRQPWLFAPDEEDDEPPILRTAMERADRKPNKEDFKVLRFGCVSGRTRAGKSGRRIFCPRCGRGQIVRSFKWKERSCTNCHEGVAKADWYLYRKP